MSKDEIVWIIVYEDQDVKPEFFSGQGAELAAKHLFKERLLKWSCHLFVSAQLIEQQAKDLTELEKDKKGAYVCVEHWREKAEQQAKEIEELKAKTKFDSVADACIHLANQDAEVKTLRTQNERLVKLVGNVFGDYPDEIPENLTDGHVAGEFSVRDLKEAKTLLAEVKPCPTTG